jgi:3-hydroxyacyl-[acyl-carrier-protein] dehydratase
MKTGKKFLGDLYSIERSGQDDDAGRSTFRIVINPRHEIFMGHFPGNPVLPGACTLQIIKELAEEATGKNLLLSEAQSIKYLSFINPELSRILDIDIHIKGKDTGLLSCNASVHYEGTVFCSLKGTLTLLP